MRAMSKTTLILLFATAFSITEVTQTGQLAVVLYEGPPHHRRRNPSDRGPALLVENDEFEGGPQRRSPDALRRNAGQSRWKNGHPGPDRHPCPIGNMKDVTNGPENYSRENILDHMRRYAYFGVAAARAWAGLRRKAVSNSRFGNPERRPFRDGGPRPHLRRHRNAGKHQAERLQALHPGRGPDGGSRTGGAKDHPRKDMDPPCSSPDLLRHFR